MVGVGQLVAPFDLPTTTTDLQILIVHCSEFSSISVVIVINWQPTHSPRVIMMLLLRIMAGAAIETETVGRSALEVALISSPAARHSLCILFNRFSYRDNSLTDYLLDNEGDRP